MSQLTFTPKIEKKMKESGISERVYASKEWIGKVLNCYCLNNRVIHENINSL